MTTYAGQYGAEAITDNSGHPLPPGTPITIYQHGSSTLAVLYTDRTKAAVAPNPAVVDTNGDLTFYANPGQYDLAYSYAGQTYREPVTVDPDAAEPPAFPAYATAGRPAAGPAGSTYYDTTLHKPGWSDGAAWRDATGTAI